MINGFLIVFLRHRRAATIKLNSSSDGNFGINHISRSHTGRALGFVGNEIEVEIYAKQHLQIGILLRGIVTGCIDDYSVVTTLQVGKTKASLVVRGNLVHYSTAESFQTHLNIAGHLALLGESHHATHFERLRATRICIAVTLSEDR